MNLPNKLTMMRMVLIIPLVLFLQNIANPNNILFALIVFTIASITDMLDGMIARKQNLVTTFGKLMDPLADKLLVMAAMLCFVELEWTPAFVVIIILAREFLVTSVRLIAAGAGNVISADNWGKAKTVVQMIWIIFTLVWMWIVKSNFLEAELTKNISPTAYLIIDVLMIASVILTVISGANYVIKNKELIFADR